MSEYFIIVEDLRKEFEDEVVLQDINFKVKEGGSFGILGKSGSGKTALMNAIRGIKEYRPTKGSVIYRIAYCTKCGRVEPPSKKGEKCPKCEETLGLEEINLWESYGTPKFKDIYNRNAMMIQRTFALFGEMPVLVNVMEALNDAEVQRSKQQIMALRLLSKVNLTHRVLHVARDLSGGEKQRVVLARQLAKSPMVLFADEPTGTLDPVTAEAVHEVMKKEIDRGLTTFVTSHWLDAITALTEEGMILDEGSIIASGKSSEMINEIKVDLERATAVIGELKEISKTRVKEERTCINVEDCKKKFYTFDRGIIKAVDGISFEVKEGEIFGIIGVSGSGKTTLGKIMAGLQDPSSGEVTIRIGDDWVDMKTPGEKGRGRARPYISILHQEYDLYHHSSILENLTDSIGLAMPKEIAKAKANVVLKAVGFTPERVKELLDLYPDLISEGEKQRIGIARALMTEPAILILDEPTGTVDPVTLNDITRSILKSREELGQTYVIISHDPEFVETVCDRALLMRAGRKVEMGEPDKIVKLFDDLGAPMAA
ncbi:MAG: methyl coenzyme M reductase system, component A2 [Halobacteriota archaeon]|nr:methyl coenzyme M reductase system, component A2 [Halobacteriota archaeon]